jgi:glycerol kinase
LSVLIGIDQGTTGTRVVAFGAGDRVLAEEYREVAAAHPQPGWVEKDADEVVHSVSECLAAVVGQIGGAAVDAVGLDNEGETIVAWDAETLQPLAPAIVWSCRRSQGVVDRLRAAGAEPRVRELAGTPLDPYFSSTKMRWLLENDESVAAAAEAGRIRFGTFDAYLCARLGDGARTDPSTAARTQLQRIDRPGMWDQDLCGIFGVDPAWLPPIGSSVGELGRFAGLPLGALLVDQTAALAGHGCLAPGAAKATYGTGVFVLANAGSSPPAEPGGLLPTVAWQERSITYALDGGVFSAGSAMGWLQELGLVADPGESEALARSVADTGGVRFLPALTGVAAPWWMPQARGVWSGMTAHTTRAHLVRSVLEAIAWRVRDIVDAMRAAGAAPPLLRVDGGMTGNRWLMQRQADVLGIPVRVAAQAEATALGVARAAAAGVGRAAFAGLAELAETGETIEPSAGSAAWRDSEHSDWRRWLAAAGSLPA